MSEPVEATLSEWRAQIPDRAIALIKEALVRRAEEQAAIDQASA